MKCIDSCPLPCDSENVQVDPNSYPHQENRDGIDPDVPFYRRRKFFDEVLRSRTITAVVPEQLKEGIEIPPDSSVCVPVQCERGSNFYGSSITDKPVQCKHTRVAIFFVTNLKIADKSRR